MVSVVKSRWKESAIARFLAAALCVCAASVVLFSDWVFPNPWSACGRLFMTGDPEVLAINEASLALPTGAVWSQFELSYDLRENETLHLVLDREEDDFAVLRLSRIPRLESGFLRYRNGGVIGKEPLPDPVATSGTIVGMRTETGYAFWVGGGAPFEVRDGPRPSRLDINLYPPNRVDLLERIALGAVTLEGGMTLARVPVRHLARSAPVVATTALLVTALLYAGGRRRASSRSLRPPPSQAPTTWTDVCSSRYFSPRRFCCVHLHRTSLPSSPRA
ncbi:MAG: hypothetical protein KJ042_03765 [Deltaproteobacteria bacterium]|nr:hypothetical protein [Deltaproteobacteria bacterium]